MFHIVYIPINTGLEVAPSSIKRRIVLTFVYAVLLRIFKKELSSARFFEYFDIIYYSITLHFSLEWTNKTALSIMKNKKNLMNAINRYATKNIK